MNKNNIAAFWILCLSLFFLLTGCNPDQEVTPPAPQPPYLDSLIPNEMVTNLNAFTLTVNGGNFKEGAVIVFNGVEKTTAFISGTQLSCQIDPEELSVGSDQAGVSQSPSNPSDDPSLPVYVRNYSTEDMKPDESDPMGFTILESFRFHEPVNISNSGNRAVLPEIAIDSHDYFHVVWRDNSTGSWVITYTRSTDYGSNWSTPQILSTETGDSYNPEIMVGDEGNVFTVWDSEITGTRQLYFSRSADSGETWSAPVIITDSDYMAYGAAGTANISGNLFLAWVEYSRGKKYEIFFSRSTDYGESWAPKMNISDNASQSVLPTIAVGKSPAVYIAWKSYNPHRGDIYFSDSLLGGKYDWSPFRKMSFDLSESTVPVMSVGKDEKLYLSWFNLVLGGGEEVRFTSSTTYGEIWSQAETIAPPSSYSSEPAIAADDLGNVNLVFDSSKVIHFTRSIDSGKTWLERYRVIPASWPGWTVFPDIALDRDGFVYLVWEDDSTGKSQVFFCSSKLPR